MNEGKCERRCRCGKPADYQMMMQFDRSATNYTKAGKETMPGLACAACLLACALKRLADYPDMRLDELHIQYMPADSGMIHDQPEYAGRH